MSELPRGWVEASLEELATDQGLVSDGDWIESKDQDPDGEVRLIQLMDLGDGDFRNRSERFLTRATAERLRCTFIQANDVLIARMPDPIGRACVFPGLEQKAVTAVDILIWRGGGHVADPQWLTKFINSPDIRARIASEAGGTTRQRIAGGRLKAIRLPTPPLPEQRRIVAKVDSLGARSQRARADLDRIPGLVARYKQAILAAAFRGEMTAEWRLRHPAEFDPKARRRDLAEQRHAHWALLAGRRRTYPEPDEPEWFADIELPNGWMWASVDQLSFLLQYGSSAKTNMDPSGIPVLRMGNIQDGGLDFADLKYLSADHDEFPDLLLSPGDLLFNRTNSPELVGKTAVFNSPTRMSFASYLIRLRTVGIEPRLLAFFINSTFGRAWVADVVNQQVGQANVNGTKLGRLAIPLPSRPEQHEIVRRVERAFAWIDRLAAEASSARTLLDRLDQAVLAKAFRGELVPQDPSDEPASVLLERIRAERAAAPQARRGRRASAGQEKRR